MEKTPVTYETSVTVGTTGKTGSCSGKRCKNREGEGRMVFHLNSMGLAGISGYLVEVECCIASGLPGFDIVGLPDAAQIVCLSPSQWLNCFLEMLEVVPEKFHPS